MDKKKSLVDIIADNKLIHTLLAIVIGFVVGALFMVMMNVSVGAAYGKLFSSIFSSVKNGTPFFFWPGMGRDCGSCLKCRR